IECEEIERMGEFQRAARNVGMFKSEEFDFVAFAHGIGGLRRHTAADAHMTGTDRALRAGARCNEAAFDQREVEAAPAFGHERSQTSFGWAASCRRSAMSRSCPSAVRAVSTICAALRRASSYIFS